MNFDNLNDNLKLQLVNTYKKAYRHILILVNDNMNTVCYYWEN